MNGNLTYSYFESSNWCIFWSKAKYVTMEGLPVGALDFAIQRHISWQFCRSLSLPSLLSETGIEILTSCIVYLRWPPNILSDIIYVIWVIKWKHCPRYWQFERTNYIMILGDYSHNYPSANDKSPNHMGKIEWVWTRTNDKKSPCRVWKRNVAVWSKFFVTGCIGNYHFDNMWIILEMYHCWASHPARITHTVSNTSDVRTLSSQDRALCA